MLTLMKMLHNRTKIFCHTILKLQWWSRPKRLTGSSSSNSQVWMQVVP